VKKLLLWSGIIALIVIFVMVVLYLSGSAAYSRFLDSIASLVQKSKTIEISSKDVFDNVESARFGNLSEVAVCENNLNILLENDESTRTDVSVPAPGRYFIVLKYRYVTQTTGSGTLEISLNGKTYLGILDNYTYYDFNDKVYDRYGNEITPEQKIFNRSYMSFIKDASRISAMPLTLNLTLGQNTLEIKNTRSAILIEKLYVVPETYLSKNLPYSQYIKGNPKISHNNKDKAIVIEAERLSFKSDALISITNEQSALVTPYEIMKKKINVVEEASYKQSGQEVFWTFYVDTPGYYKLALRYKQSTNRGVPVYRRIYVDGKVPFAEFFNYSFPYTGYDWKDYIISDAKNQPYEIYLDKGFHTLSLEVTTGIYQETIRFLQSSVKRLQEIGLEMRKLVGNNLDPNRTWDIEKYMPNVVKDLTDISNNLKNQHDKLVKIVGEKGLPSIADIVVSAELIENILRKPERLPFYIDVLSEGASSIAQRLSELSMRLKDQPMGIDKIYVFQGSIDKYTYKTTFLISAYEELQKLWLSLFNKNEPYSVYEKADEAALKIWVNRPVQYVETLQYLTDTDFTRKTGIRVVFSIMPNEQKLILASAANNVPDVAMSISNWIPFELAIRNALFPLSYFPDFFSFAEKNINIETLLPMVLENKVYGITETQNFYVLFYRKDIIEKLGIPIPNTWDDVKKILPELQRRGMNFSLPMCEQTTKYFNTTAPFFFQNKARFYTKDGLKTALNEENSVKAFELMTELFAIYGIPEQVASFYNSFRYGRIPIGIGDFGLYITLLNAADEIYGLWDIAPSPGVLDTNGQVLRYQVAGDRADVIFAKSEKKEKAWEFLKWWMSKETQVKFAKALVNRYGPTYIWNTANIEAFKELDFIDEKHKKVILEQWKWIKEVQRHPGGYMVEREVSNVWNRVVVEGYPLRTSIDRSVILINRELERKLTEFKYIVNGKKVKDFKMYDDMKDFMKTVMDRGEYDEN